MKNKIKILIAIAGLVSLLVPNFASANAGLSAYDTVAGFSTMVSVSGAPSKSSVAIIVTNPEGSTFAKQTISDVNGSASLEVPDSFTQKAGNYNVQLQGGVSSTAFTVFAGDPDAKRSGVYANKTSAAANGADLVTVQVRVVDEFLNPLEFHEVSLTSSRTDDIVTAQNKETDSEGIARFLVSSNTTGVSTLTAQDETSGTVFSTRMQIVFAGKTVYKDVGGDPETVLLAAGESTAKFRIDNLPASVSANEPVSFTLTAVDSGGAVVPTFTGTVQFSATDPNATLPNPYTFKNTDQGTMTFNVATRFATVGTHTLTATQQGNNLIKGQKTIQILAAHNAPGGSVRITKPATGTYSLNTLEIAGEALPNAQVRLFDNGQQIAQVQASNTGRFTYTTSLLTDGNHTFYAESNTIQSTPVTVTIDSTPSQVEQVDITKTEIAPGDSTSIVIRSDPNLNKVQIRINNIVVDMEEDPQNPGLYRGNIVAPFEEGVYPVEVVITDSVGNVSSPIEIGQMNVDSAFAGQGNVSFTVPTAVSNLRAAPANGRVSLSWTASQAQSGIAFYRVYYGTDPQALNIVMNTVGAVTSAEIANLQNGTPYYFQVFGVDTLGNEGDNPSETVTAIPSLTVGVLCSPDPCPVVGNPDNLPEDGPGTIGMLIASLVGGGVFQAVRRRKK